MVTIHYLKFSRDKWPHVAKVTNYCFTHHFKVFGIDQSEETILVKTHEHALNPEGCENYTNEDKGITFYYTYN